MGKILSTAKREVLEVLPPAGFFLVAFNVIVFTKRLMLEQYGIHFSHFVAATLGALVVAKVVLIADHIPFINKYPGKPLIYNVVWKTVIYLAVAFVVRFGEALAPLWLQSRDLGVAYARLYDEVVWPHFWVIQIWLACLFFVYVAFRELARTLGEAEFLWMFLGVRIMGEEETGRG